MEYGSDSKINVLISGAAGLVGSALCEMLSEMGYNPIILSRKKNPSSKYRTVEWNVEKQSFGEGASELEADYVIHLAGAGIADEKWSAKRKAEIISSRVNSAEMLAKLISGMKKKPKAFISAAAIGIYGNRPKEALDEFSPIKKESPEFLVQSCIQWEAAAEPIRKLGIRTAVLRIGIVLSTRGGALAKMLPSYNFRTGAYFGNGEQYYSWIHIEDLCRIFAFLMENPETEGIFNAVAPNPEKNRVLASKIAEAKNQKSILVPVPAFAMKLVMGEMSAIVLDSAEVYPKRLQEAGFTYKFPELGPALKDLISRKI